MDDNEWRQVTITTDMFYLIYLATPGIPASLSYYNGRKEKNLCPGITPKLINLQPIMIHYRTSLIVENAYKENNVVRRRIKSRVGFDFRLI